MIHTPTPLVICVLFVTLVDLKGASGLTCYQQSSQVGEPVVSQGYCQPEQFPYCVKATSGNYVLRDCDKLYYCEQFGNGCMTVARYGQIFGEVCCCNTDRCNSASAFKVSLVAVLLLVTVLVYV
uniref:UPAR/Ly6 domain-containing protein n=1 Tax=Steinernema glaseri TaxID=37863 RepID=A0A1I7YZB3_9BILA